ncbi:MAG TPA: alpha/beta hydrolase-fold protein [Longimicrobiales bacterium]
MLSAGLAGVAASQTPELRLHDFTSRVFNNTRKLRVLLPAGYDAPQNRGRRYPVLYLNDGQNLFDSTTATLNPMEWQVDETVATLTRAGVLPPLIVVGIDNAGRRDRFKEYFPYYDEYLQPPEPNPQGKRYPAFLVDEVIPFVEARYRVARGADNRGIGGSSAGALAAMYAVASRPGIFGKLLVESPSIYVDDYHILRDARPVKRWPQRIYLGAGTNEGNRTDCDPASPRDRELVNDLERFRRLLLDAGVAANRIDLTVTPCAVHNEQAWAARLPHALTFLFGGSRTSN